MNKVLLLLLFISTFSFGMEIKSVSNSELEKQKEQNFFMKNDRKIIKAFLPEVIKAFQPEVIKAFEVKGKLVIPKSVSNTNQVTKVEQKLKKEDITKQFAKKDELKVENNPKEKLKVSNESADFFESLNQEDNKPVNME